MCRSLANHGYAVNLVVADGKGDETREGVNIIDAGASKDRFDRIRNAPGRIFARAVALNADLYHLHDPELIPIGLKLKKLGKRVVFDSHEDVPLQMLGKPYLNRPMRWGIAQALRVYEVWACKQFDGVIAATPFIRDKFLKINSNTLDINNFPLLDELANTSDWDLKANEVVYVGGISKIRGIEEVILAMDFTQGVRLNLAGQFIEKALEEQVKNHEAWSKVNELGFLNRQQVNEVLAKSRAGLVTLQPVINYIDALPVKMFEYMSAGIPIIASNFPLWREIVEGNQCGLCVDPLEPKAIGEAIQFLIDHPAEAEKMGKNGRQAVEQKYNWSIEEDKLLKLYKELSE